MRGLTSAGGATLASILCATVALLQDIRPTQAMPPFAQALNVNCETCHTAVPALNAYGRFVQRTGYAALDPATVHRALPVWIGEQPSYDSLGQTEQHKIQLGNLAVHAIGYLGKDWTFHAQQWITQSDQPGGTDTMWLSYDRVFRGDGHLFIGKIEAPAPSPYSQWFELAGFAAPSITVGEHAWQYASNRWGTKFQYTHGWLEADLGYLASGGDLNTAGDFSSSEEKTVQWRAAWAFQDKPLELGAYGSNGVFPLSNGSFDRYRGTAVYAELDPVNGDPGFFAVYQRGFDAQPMPGVSSISSRAFSVDAFEPVFGQRVMIGVRHEYSDDGLGNATYGNDLDVEWQARRSVTRQNVTGILVNAELATGKGVHPEYRYQLWYVTTLGPLR